MKEYNFSFLLVEKDPTKELVDDYVDITTQKLEAGIDGVASVWSEVTLPEEETSFDLIVNISRCGNSAYETLKVVLEDIRSTGFLLKQAFSTFDDEIDEALEKVESLG